MPRRRILSIALVSITSIFCIGCASARITPDTKHTEPTKKTQLSPDEVIKMISPAVVTIVATKDLPIYKPDKYEIGDPIASARKYENGIYREVSAGSGFIIENGLILTNNHVVNIDGADYSIILNNGTEYESKVVRRDTENDIALLKLKNDIDKLPAIRLGDSEEIQIGQNVVSLQNSGTVISVNQNISAGAIYLTGLIQTDIPFTPGDSGGPLVNMYGEVIGINTAFSTMSEDEGFAIPINLAVTILD